MLAATLSPSYGIYSGFEPCENVPVRRGQRGVPRLREVRGAASARLDGPLLPLVRRLNEIRRAHPALQRRHRARSRGSRPRTTHLLAYAKGARATTSSSSSSTSTRSPPTTGVCVDPGALGLPAGFAVVDGLTASVRLGRAELRPLAGVRRRSRRAGSVGAHIFRRELDARDRRRTSASSRRSGREPAGASTSAEHWFESQPHWFKTAVFYEVHVARRSSTPTDDGIGRLPRAHRRSSTTCSGSGSTASGCCRSTPRRCATAATTSPTSSRSHPELRHARRLRGVRRGGARARHPGHHRPRDEPHLDQHPWFQESRQDARQPEGATATSGRTPTHRYADARIIFVDTEPSNWTCDPVRRRVLLAPLLPPPAGPQLRQPGGAGGDARRRSASGSTSASTASGSTPSRTCSSAEGTNCENLPETHAFLQARARGDRRELSRTACCSPRRTSGPRTSSTTSATATSATWRSTSR